jgi:hypothetical protein
VPENLEPLDADHGGVPADLLELYEVLEWQAAADERRVSSGQLGEDPGADHEPPARPRRRAAAALPTNFVSRSAWGARQPTGVTKLRSPRGNTLHWEGPTMGTFPHTSCASKVRGIQAFHMDSRGWTDIAYSSVLCPHGYVFQGRWLGVRTAANGTNEGNDASYAHCLLLGQGDPFPDDAKRAAVAAFQHFELSGSGVGRWCHRDWKATACPGDAPCAWLKAGMPVYGSPTAPVSPAYPTLTRSAQEAAMKFEAIRNPDTGAIAVVSPGFFRQLDGEQWEVVKSKGLAPAEPQVVNQREWDVIRAVAYGGEEPEQARAAD